MELDLDGLISATVLPMYADGSIDEKCCAVTSAESSIRDRSRWQSTSTPARGHSSATATKSASWRPCSTLPTSPSSPESLAVPPTRQFARPASSAPPVQTVCHLSDPRLPERAAQSRGASRVPLRHRRGWPPLDHVPATTRNYRRELRSNHPSGSLVDQRLRRDQGGLLRRPSVHQPAHQPPLTEVPR